MPTTRPPHSSPTDASRELSPHDERRIAVAAAVDPRTARRYRRGQAVVSTCRARIEGALDALGLTDLVVRVEVGVAPARRQGEREHKRTEAEVGRG